MRQEQAQQAARDEKLVPTEDRVKIGKSNLSMDPTLTQKEETYQVMLDIIKNTPCSTPFSLLLMLQGSTDISEMYVDHMHQIWRTLRAIINKCLSRKTSRDAGDACQPPPIDADVAQANAALRILKKDWFKKAPRPETLDLD
ncbi:hypothetical protein Tco_0241603 [Tanacetum coccineum]